MNLLDILTAPWAIQPEKLIEIRDIYLAHVRGEVRDFTALEARLNKIDPDAAKPYQVVENVALIPIDGVIAKRMNLMQRISGGSSSQLIQRDIKAALADPDIRGILLQIDSPGGTVDGTQELAQLVRQGAEDKPIAAWSDGVVGSAAYWIASAAPQLFISGDVVQAGSIGVVATHVDVSKAEESRGIKTTEIVAGRYKRIASQHAPLSDEGRRALQDQVDYLYQIFVGEVANHRARTPEQVHAEMADGRVFIGRQAIAAGLVDDISTQERLILDLARGRVGRRTSLVPAPVAQTNVGVTAMNETTAPALTLEAVTRDYPAIAEALRAEGAGAERQRIRDVEAQALGAEHEALIAAMKWDGQTTPAQAAVRILEAERALRQRYAAQARADAPLPVLLQPPPAEERASLDNLPVEERCKAKWDKSPELRAEFGGRYETYLAFEKANEKGLVRVKAAA